MRYKLLDIKFIPSEQASYKEKNTCLIEECDECFYLFTFNLKNWGYINPKAHCFFTFKHYILI